MTSFHVLGPLALRNLDREIDISPGHEALLLAILLSNGHAGVSVRHIVDALWEGEPPRSAEKSVQVYIHRLRRKIGPQWIRYRHSRYLITVSESSLDALNFLSLASRGQEALARGDATTAARLLRTSLDLWRGNAYADFESNPAVWETVQYLNERRLVTTEDYIDAERALGRHRDVVPKLTALTAAYPLRERFREQLMIALHHSGRRADALVAYRDARRYFLDEVGVEPSSELRRLHQKILTSDDRGIDAVTALHRARTPSVDI
jgi:DNA-binding SARP family transcriptional activator